jgi:hypothetical protein
MGPAREIEIDFRPCSFKYARQYIIDRLLTFLCNSLERNCDASKIAVSVLALLCSTVLRVNFPSNETSTLIHLERCFFGFK